jgi:hypothetical protein
MAGLVPAIHAFLHRHAVKTWMPATSAGMTKESGASIRTGRARTYYITRTENGAVIDRAVFIWLACWFSESTVIVMPAHAGIQYGGADVRKNHV